MKKYSVTIIDDCLTDILALKKIISDYCIDVMDFNYSLSIDDGILEVQKHKPDIIFLNIKFRDSVIFDYLDLFQLENVSVIFTSSDRNFAINAFENNAVDFVLKPFRVENVVLAMNKAKKAIESFCSEKKTKTFDFDFLAIASLDKVDFVEMKDIVFCMADGKYTTFFLTSGKKIVSSKNLGEYEKLLNDTFFYRVHHAYIINIKCLISIIKKDGVYCELVNKVTIPIAKRRQEDFNKFIKLKH
jgi:two-component system LytT family response regulator